MVAHLSQKTLRGHAPRFEGQNLWRGARIGLLGGSFNPAHKGHLHISLEAIKRLQLDHVWWLVSPQNPLKDTSGLALLQDRVAGATALTSAHPAIHVTDIEKSFGTTRTIDTLSTLKTACPETQFIWLMGADNMIQFDQWASWQDIVALLPIAIFDRTGYSIKALQGKFAKRYAHLRVSPNEAKNLGRKKTKVKKQTTEKPQGLGLTKETSTRLKTQEPISEKTSGLGWVFLPCPQHPQSSTNIRNLKTTASNG